MASLNPPPSLREARMGDCAAVVALMQRNGLVVNSTTRRWAWLWHDNPAVAGMRESMPIGWVLENGNGIVGYLGNLPLAGRFNGKMLRIAAARGFAVDPGTRGNSLRLAAAFFSQKGADLLLNTSANAAAASVFGLCKAGVLPQADYNNVLLWVLKSRPFAESYLRKFGKAPWLAKLAAPALAVPIAAEGMVRRRALRSDSSGHIVDVLEPGKVGEEFDVLWAAIVQTRPNRLLADRSAATLRWHFNRDHAPERHASLLALRVGGTLAGYAAITRENSEQLGLKRSRISDLVAKDDDVGVIDALLAASYEYASAEGSHALELVGFPRVVRERALRGNPHSYRLPSQPYWYKALDPTLASDLEQERAWYGSPYDGDVTL